jgi:adenylate cyclase
VKFSSSRFAKIFIVVYTLFFLVLYLPRFVGMENAGAFSHIQFVWQDSLFRHDAESLKQGDPRLILVSLDEETGKKYGFPLPRPVYAPTLDKLKALGVKIVIFDVMFFEPREGDAQLAAATRRFGRVVHCFAQDEQMTAHGSNTITSLPIPPLLKATKYIGHPNITDLLDEDGHVRRFSLFRAGVPDPLRDKFDAVSLEAVTLAADQDKTIEEIRSEYGSDIRSLNFRQPRMWLRHEKRDAGLNVENVEQVFSPYRRISLLDILSGELSADQRKALKGSIVEIGSTSLGYFDHLPTPFIEAAPGAEFHLNALDNLLHRDAMDSWSRLTTLLLIVVAMALTFVFQYFSPTVGAALTGATLLGWLVFALAMFRRGVIVEFIPPAAALVSSYLIMLVKRVRDENQKKDEIKGLFGQFVAPEVVEKLAGDPTQVKLGGEKRDMTVFFLDIAHFTNISEKMEPEALIHFLNRYLSELSAVIFKHHGTIDKYIGDCIVAFWNAPLENKDHRLDAVLAALECQQVIARLNETPDKGLPEIPAVRIGINSGNVTVGLTGSLSKTYKKLAYTVIGDEVNLASRLEGANKFFGSKIIVSESAYEGCRGRIEARYLGRAKVIGKETPIKVYEPLAEKGKLSPEWAKALPIYEEGVAAFDARRYDESLAAFQKFAEIFPEDGPGQLYLRITGDYAAIPPDAAWDGVFNLREK